MRREEKQQGIVLSVLLYKERDRILRLFTPEKGLISLIVKGLSRKKLHLLALTTPFAVGEFHYQIGNSSLYRFCDGALLESHLPLREKLTSLEAAGTLIQALLATQMQGKPAPDLYRLTLAYLNQIPLFEDPAPLILSFLLKLLKHEGTLAIQNQCTHCEKDATHLHLGETLCDQHLPSYAKALPLGRDEWSQLHDLLEVRQFEVLKNLPIKVGLKEKIHSLFDK